MEMTDIITLNIGGITYVTTKETLIVPNSYFESMFSGKMKPGVHIDDAIFIDRNGKIFEHVLNYLRNRDRWTPPPDIGLYGDLFNEANFYGLTDMKKILLDLKPSTFFIFCTYKEKDIDITRISCYSDPENVSAYLKLNLNEDRSPKNPSDWHIEEIIKMCSPQYKLSKTIKTYESASYVFTSTLESNILHRIQTLNK